MQKSRAVLFLGSFLYALIAGFILMAVGIPSAQAFGISPPSVEVNALMRGTTQYRTITLLRSPLEDVDGPLYVKVEADPENGTFIVVEEEDLVMLKGQDSLEITVGINSGDAPNGDYVQYFRALKMAEPGVTSGDNAQVSIVTGVTAKVFVTVGGEEVLEYRLIDLFGSDTEVGLPVGITYLLSNSGNVNWKPEKIDFEFFDKVTGASVGVESLAGEGMGSALAGMENQNFDVNVDVQLPEGDYVASATFYDQGVAVGTLESVHSFHVFPEGTLALTGELKSALANKERYASGEKIKFDALFENTSTIPYGVTILSDVYHNDEYIDYRKSDVYELEAGEEVVVTDILSFSEAGEYRLETWAEFGKKKTAKQAMSFIVTEEVYMASAAVGAVGSSLNTIVGLGVLIFLIMLLAIVIKKRKQKAIAKQRLLMAQQQATAQQNAEPQAVAPTPLQPSVPQAPVSTPAAPPAPPAPAAPTSTEQVTEQPKDL